MLHCHPTFLRPWHSPKIVAPGLSGATPTPSMALLDGARHVAVTMGSAGVLLASARPINSVPIESYGACKDNNTGSDVVESSRSSGRWFALSAEHYPALPLEEPREGAATGEVVDCTGAGDCLVAGMVGGLALGWSLRESVFLGLVRAFDCFVGAQSVICAGINRVFVRLYSRVLNYPVIGAASWLLVDHALGRKACPCPF